MPNTTVFTNNQYYQEIAAAIRAKNGLATLYKPSEMAPAILQLAGGTINLQTVSVNPSTSTQTITPGSGYAGLNAVTVYAIPTETKTTTVNGVITPTAGKFLTSVTVSVPVGSTINNQDKTVTPTESVQTISADAGYTGLGDVTIAAIPTTYVGSGVATKSSADLTANGATITAPAGYYASAASKSVATTTVATPTVTVNSSGKAIANVTQNAGYTSGGTTTASVQLTTKSATTITPSTATQTAVNANVYTTGAITVAAISTQTKTTTVNGDVVPDSGKYLTKVTVNVPVGATINNQDKTVTSSTVSQIINADSGYTGLGTVTVNAIATAVQATPAAAITNSTGVISATATQSAGYVVAGTKTGTAQLTVQAGATITPKATSQTAVASYRWTTGTITVAAVPTETVTLTSNGTHNATSGKFWSSVTVSIPSDINNQDKTVTSSTVTQTVSADSGYSGLGTITINAIATAVQATPAAAITNSTGVISATATQAAGYVTAGTKTSTAQLTTQAGKTITPSETAQTAVASYRWTTGTVTVAAIPSDYVGSGITQNTSLNVNGKSVTAPAGYYATAVTTNVATATIGTMSVGINSSGLITATATRPEGWFVGGSQTATTQVPTQAGTTVTPTAATQTIVTSGKYTTGDIKVAAVPTDTNNTFTSNGTKTPASGKWFSSVVIDVPVGSTITNSEITVTPTESQQTITTPSGYTGIGTVTVNAIPSDYVGSVIAQRGDSDVTITGSTINVPRGYYDDAVTVTVASVAKATPAITVNSSGLISATVTQGTGYVSGGTTTTTSQLTVQAGKTVTPTAAAQTAVASGRYTTGTITVAAVPTDTNNTFTTNGTKTPASGKWFSSVVIDVPVGVTLNNQDKTVTPTESAQTISADSGYTGLGTVTVNAISSTYIGSGITQRSSSDLNGTTWTYTDNGTYPYVRHAVTVSAGYYPNDISTTFTKILNDVTNLPKQAAATITPTATLQTAVAKWKWTTGDVTVAAVPTDTSNTFLANGTYTPVSGKWFDSVTVSVPSDINNQAKTAASSTATQTIKPDTGYSGLSQVTITPIAVSTITNGLLNVSTVTEATNDYGVEASITIPAGYYNTTTLSKVLSNVLPAPATAISISQMLSGYQAYDYQGKLLSGTMTNRAAWSATLDQTTTSVTIPEGYHNGTGTVSHTTVDIPNPTFSMANSTGIITASGSWTRGFTTDNSYTNTYSLTTQAGKTVTPSETTQTAVASCRWTTGTITVAAISSTYVGSGVATITQLNTSANTVTAPAGYYTSALTHTVPAMTVPTSTSASSTGTRQITVTPSGTTTQYINLPTGYNPSAVYFQINKATAGAATGPSSVSGTAASLTTGNNTLTLSKTISITPVITTTGWISAGTATNATVQLTATVTTKAAATYTPGTTNQTIAAGTYLTGVQTIQGDADLIAENIASGANIFGIDGTFTDDATATASDIVDGETAYVEGRLITGNLIIQRYYTGSGIPSSTLGVNGDLYLRS